MTGTSLDRDGTSLVNGRGGKKGGASSDRAELSRVLDLRIASVRADVGNRKWTGSEARVLNGVVTRLLRVEPNIVPVDDSGGTTFVVGDTHGYRQGTAAIIRAFLDKLSLDPDTRIVFLGDYVDRGPDQVGNINDVLSLKVEFPGNVTLLRGNHEDEELNEAYGFTDEVHRAYGGDFYRENYLVTFRALPVAARTESGFLLVHGGIPEIDVPLDRLDRLRRDVTPLPSYLDEMLWNDPDGEGDRAAFSPNRARGIGKTFSGAATGRFLRDNGLRAVIRSHERVPTGVAAAHGGRVITVFSSPVLGGDGKFLVIRDGRVSSVDIGALEKT